MSDNCAFRRWIPAFSGFPSVYLRAHLKSHLVLSFCYRYFSAFWLLAAMVILIGINLISQTNSNAEWINIVVATLMISGSFLFFGYEFSKSTQAALVWIVMKFSFAFICVACLLIGVPSDLRDNDPMWSLLLAFGLIWMPSIEFIPRYINKQSWITIGRFLLSFFSIFLFALFEP